MAETLTLEVDALLFDMDGTIVDSSESVYRQWRLWAERNNLDVPTVLATMPGRRAAEVMQIVAPHLLQPDAINDLLAAEEKDMEGVKPIAGAPELLQSIPANRWAVVTSATHKVASLRIAAAGLPQPGVLIAADQVTNGKPDPEGFLKAAAALGVDPERCVVFEDAVAGVQAAINGGMRVVGLTTHHPAEELAPARCVANLRPVRADIGDQSIRLHIAGPH